VRATILWGIGHGEHEPRSVGRELDVADRPAIERLFRRQRRGGDRNEATAAAIETARAFSYLEMTQRTLA
jgi:hypothetical protein